MSSSKRVLLLLLLAAVASGCLLPKSTRLDAARKDTAPDAPAKTDAATHSDTSPTADSSAEAALRDAGANTCMRMECDSDDAGATTSGATASCMGGECWWSHEHDRCRSAGAPTEDDRPSTTSSEASAVPEIYLGLNHMRLGQTNSSGVSSQNAWQELGLDLDGLCTRSNSCSQSMQQACRAPMRQSLFDGTLCRDNTAAGLMTMLPGMPELGQRLGLSEDQINCNLRRGSYNVILKISNYNGQSDDAQVRVDFYISSGTVRSQSWQCPEPDFANQHPLWRLSEPWRVDPDNLTGPIANNGKLPDSRVADSGAYVRSDYLIVRFPNEMLFRLAGSAARGRAWVSSQNIWTGKLHRAQNGVWSLSDGIIAGRIGRTDLIRSLRQAGVCETGSLSAHYDSIVELVDQNLDLRLDGSVDVNQPCDAVSFGWGYSASQLTPGPTVNSPPLVECCDPETAIEDCNPKCGDGRRSGNEKCDTAVPAGEPDACPTECPTLAECVPRLLNGTQCQTECVLRELTCTSGDHCCPSKCTKDNDTDCAQL